MKRFLCSILAIFMIFALFGCANNNNEAVLAKRLSKSTYSLLTAINNLEEVTSEDVTIPEFSSNESSVNSIQNISNQTNRVSKVKKLFKNNDLVNIKNIENRNVEPKFMSNSNNQNYIDRSIYQPKYVSNNTTNTSTYLDIFKSKMENLYNTCNDCNYVNAECNRCQDKLKTAVSEC